MSYTWINRVLVVAVLLCAVPGLTCAEPVGPPAPDAAAASQVRPPSLLTIESNGLARFEIEGQDVVANYSGGVRAAYAGYELTCDELRLNQQTQVAQLAGHINVTGRQVQFAAQSVTLDLDDGTAQVNGGLRGSMQDGRLSFEAGEAQMQLRDPKGRADAQSVTAQLSGNVLLGDSQGSQLSMASAVYDGATGRLTVPGQFIAVLTASTMHRSKSSLQGSSFPTLRGARRPTEGVAGPGVDGPLHFAGANLVANFSNQGVLQTASISDPRIAANGAQLWAASAVLQATAQGHKLIGFTLQMKGSPISGTVDNAGTPIFISAGALDGTIKDGDLTSFALRGRVRINSRGMEGQADELTLRPGSEGRYTLYFPRGIHAAGNMSTLSGQPVHTLDELRLGRNRK